MNENENFLGMGLFFFAIVLIVVTGSILIFLNNKSKQENNIFNETKTISDDLKIDKSKDFIYYTGDEVISTSLNIIKKYPVINIKSDDALKITNEIKSYVDLVSKDIEKSDEEECEDNILEATTLEYATFNYQEYASLLIRETSYNCEDGFSSVSKVKGYTVNVTTGEYLDFTKLLKKYNLTFTEVIEKIKENLNSEIVQIEETIDNLKEQETFTSYIDEHGYFVLNYVVKTDEVDYNDTIILNG